MAGMVLVNTQGDQAQAPALLRHAQWHGCTLADLVFPFFLFAAGAASAFSFARFDYRLSAAAALKISRRVALIFILGLFLNAFPFTGAISGLRIMGVLQRIALAWGAAAVLCLVVRREWLPGLALAVLAGYSLIMTAYGGGEPWSLEGNLVRRIDLAVLGADHMWKGAGIAFDPEGLLSTLPAAVTVITGFMAGRFFRSDRAAARAASAAALGAASVAGGLLLHSAVPVNKSLWTGSYVLLTSGLASVLLSILVLTIEGRRYNRWTYPLIVYGTNPLLLFLISGIWVRTIVYLVRITGASGERTSLFSLIYQRLFASLLDPVYASVSFALAHACLYWIVLFILYRKGVSVRI